MLTREKAIKIAYPAVARKNQSGATWGTVELRYAQDEGNRVVATDGYQLIVADYSGEQSTPKLVAKNGVEVAAAEVEGVFPDYRKTICESPKPASEIDLEQWMAAAKTLTAVGLCGPLCRRGCPGRHVTAELSPTGLCARSDGTLGHAAEARYDVTLQIGGKILIDLRFLERALRALAKAEGPATMGAGSATEPVALARGAVLAVTATMRK